MKTKNGEQNVEGSEAKEDSDIKENHDNNNNNNNNNNSIYYQKKFFENIPSGYQFCPSDNQLIVDYLKKKVLNQTLPLNRIVEVNLYHFNPDTLAEKYEKHGEKEWYFFTPRDRKYRNGSRPNRAAGDGYWKATGADKKVKYNNEVVGYRKALVFYKGKPPKGTKTSWIMHEFRVSDPPRIIKRDEYDMKLDEWVLCRIYKKDETKYNRSNKPKKETSIEESDDHDNKEILLDAGEILPINNNTNNYFDYQSNYFLPINNISPNPLFQLRDMNSNTIPFKQGYLRKFMFPNDNGNYHKGHAMDKLGYFDAPTSFHQPQMEMDHHEEEVKHMTSQF